MKGCGQTENIVERNKEISRHCVHARRSKRSPEDGGKKIGSRNAKILVTEGALILKSLNRSAQILGPLKIAE